MHLPQHTVTSDDDGIRLDRWFKRHYPGLQHALLEKSLRKGLIRVGGKKAKSSDRVEAGQAIEVRIQDPEFSIQAKNQKARPLSSDDIRMIRDAVLYKDVNIIVVNKPYGLPVQGGSKIARSLDDLLDGLTFEAKERPKLVHRLDRDTSGALVLARSARAAHQLMKLFSTRKVEKTYWALVNGCPMALKGVIHLSLRKKESPKVNGRPGGPEGRDYEIMQVDAEGQKAITEYRVLDACARRFALMELKPLTGRTHQLRVHMASIGCPITGDHKYGGSMEDATSLGVENILHLHARRIVIPGFSGGKTVGVTVPLPLHMKRSFEALGINIQKND